MKQLKHILQGQRLFKRHLFFKIQFIQERMSREREQAGLTVATIRILPKKYETVINFGLGEIYWSHRKTG